MTNFILTFSDVTFFFFVTFGAVPLIWWLDQGITGKIEWNYEKRGGIVSFLAITTFFLIPMFSQEFWMLKNWNGWPICFSMIAYILIRPLVTK